MPKPRIEVLARGICSAGDRVLVCRNAGRGIHYLPGGHVEYGEPARVALEREIEEELGLPSHAGDFLGGIEHGFEQDGVSRYEVNLVFVLTVEGLAPDRPPVAAESHLRFAWVPLAELADDTLEPAILRDCLPAWLAGNGPSWLSCGSLAGAPGWSDAAG